MVAESPRFRHFLVILLSCLTITSVLFVIRVLGPDDQRFKTITGLATGINGPSTANRTFNVTTVHQPARILVTLTLVPLYHETFYAMEETVPAGFTVWNAGSGSWDPAHRTIKWYYININDPHADIPPGELIKTYVVITPPTAGTYAFSGQYEFENDTAPAPIGGQTDIIVQGCTSACTVGQTECADGTHTRTCVDDNNDGCGEWGTSVPCPTDTCTGDTCWAATYSDYPIFNQAQLGTCQEQCSGTPAACHACQPSYCVPVTEACAANKECQQAQNNCNGIPGRCRYSSSYAWASGTLTETSCTDAHDNDCNGMCDYDAASCTRGETHGDAACPVQLMTVAVNDTAPVEHTYITVSCTANTGGIHSIFVDLNGVTCPATAAWQGSVASFSCQAGSAGPTTVRCNVDDRKSYQAGQNVTTQVTVQQSPCTGLGQTACNINSACAWCLGCSGAQGNGIGADACVPKGSCLYSCNVGQCGATCNPFTECPATPCDSTCYDTTTLTVKADIPNSCTDSCGCSQQDGGLCGLGTNVSCGSQTCELHYPGQHLTGTCSNTCIAQPGDDACQNCTLTYPGPCACEPGYADYDGNPANGCEAETCNLAWSCTPWSGDGCGDRACTCACPGGLGCSGDHATHIECPIPPPGGGSSPSLFKGGGSPSMFKGGSSPLFAKKEGGSPLFAKDSGTKTDACTDGKDNEGNPPKENGCIDRKDAVCGGKETACYGGIDDDCDGMVDCADPDCSADPYCQEQGQQQEGPVYTVYEALDKAFNGGQPQNTPTTESFKSVADVETFFGFMNWLIIGVLVVLFFGLIFVQHVKPAASVPHEDMDQVAVYIKGRLAKGESEADIRQKLRNVGWIDEVIDKGFPEKEGRPRIPASIPTSNEPQDPHPPAA